MSLYLSRLVRYAARRIAYDQKARDLALQAARTVADEAKLVARDEDPPRAAGPAPPASKPWCRRAWCCR